MRISSQNARGIGGAGHPPGPLSVQVLQSDHLARLLVELVKPAQRLV